MDLEGVELVVVNCLLLLLGWVGLVEGLVDQHVVMLTLRMKLWWVAAVLRELGVIGREWGLLPLGWQPQGQRLAEGWKACVTAEVVLQLVGLLTW